MLGSSASILAILKPFPQHANTRPQGHPIHLWDACSGALRAAYSAHNDADDPTAAYSIAFSPDGSKLLGGYAKCYRVFDVGRPGRDCKTVHTQQRKREGSMAGAWAFAFRFCLAVAVFATA